MTESQAKLRDISWYELCPWLMLTRSVRIALLARVLILGAVGLIATTIGWSAIGWFFSENEAVKPWHDDLSRWAWEQSSAFAIPMSARSADDIFFAVIERLPQAPVELWLYFTKPFRGLFSNVTAMAFFYLLLCAVWEVVVWGLIGGAITRIAALKFTRDEAPGPVAALQHSAAKLVSYSMPPFVALAGAAVFAVQLAILGVLMRIDFFAFLAGLAWPFVLLLGLMMAILLLGALIGWPFMWATISVEGTDAFDALSRSYAYTYHRPWRLLWYVVYVALLAAISMFVVKMFAASAIALGDWSVDWGLDNKTMVEVVHSGEPAVTSATDVPQLEPPATDAGPMLVPPADAAAAVDAATTETTAREAGPEIGMFRSGAMRAIAFWKSLMAALAAGYQAGFLWVAAVGVYLQLRRDIDGVQTSEVYLEHDEHFGAPPLAQDAATGVPEVLATQPALPGDAAIPGESPRSD